MKNILDKIKIIPVSISILGILTLLFGYFQINKTAPFSDSSAEKDKAQSMGARNGHSYHRTFVRPFFHK